MTGEKREEEVKASVDKRLQLFKSMPKPLQSLVKIINDKLDGLVNSTLETFWQIGKELDKASRDQKVYGDDPIAKIENVLDRDRGFLLKAHIFFLEFDENLLEKLFKSRTKFSKKFITWSHVIHLLTLKTREDRERYIDLILENDWTVEDLIKAIKEEFRKDTVPVIGIGRPLKIPQKLEAKLSNMDKILSMVIRNNNQIWNDSSEGIYKSVTSSSADSLSEKTVTRIEEEMNKAVEAVDSLQKLISSMQKAKEHVEKVLQNKEEDTTTSDSDEE